MQDAVVIEYGHKLQDSHLHGFAMQLMDDVSVPASFIGVAPSGPHGIIPKLEVGLSFSLQSLCRLQGLMCYQYWHVLLLFRCF